MRKKFNLNHMPSGTLEMENLRNQIDRDSSSSDEGELDDDPTLSAGMCMALALKDDDVPRSWKQAVEIPHWLEAMERDELEALGAGNQCPDYRELKRYQGYGDSKSNMMKKGTSRGIRPDGM
ncbi:MAG: hypothetical protein GY696_35890 [Gammaproteobacteria bacterium]|nr:hypothetical protein [Gammaproteobacteria bacterium]